MTPMSFKIVHRTIRPVQDFDYPRTLYKYRNFVNPHHISILKKQEIYFSFPSDFEDPLDCKVPTRVDLLTNTQIRKIYEHHSREMNPHFSRKQHKEHAIKWKEKGLLKNKSRLRKLQAEQFAEYNKRIGVFSITENYQSEEMWNKYSENFTGFCVGFEPRVLFDYLGGGGKVIYQKELPTIWPRPMHSFDDQIRLQVFTKLEKWSFEEEYRTTIFSNKGLLLSDRIIKIPKDSFREVIIGDGISTANEEYIRQAVKDEFGSLPIKKAKFDGTEVQVF